MKEIITIDETLKKKIAVFGALTRDEITELLGYMERREYQAGEKIFLQNSSPENIYIVEAGEVDFIYNGKKENYLLKKYTVGDCFGEIALLGIISNFGDCIAKDKISLLQLSKFSFHKLSKENNKLFTKLLFNITREICRYNYNLTNNFIEKLEKNIV